MGKIILSGTEKGGVGKSTTALNLAVALANEHYKGDTSKILLVDADPQGTLYAWSQRREENESLNGFPCIQLLNNISQQVRREAERYDYVIIDVSGRDKENKELRSAMTVADVMLIPTSPSLADLEVLPSLVNNIETAQIYNEKLKACVFINKADSKSQREIERGRNIIKEFHELTFLRTRVLSCIAHREAIVDGRGVHELKNHKAKGEISCLLKEVLNEL
ncbi:AAA family ATPase [Vibrio parahaemolyticus]|uniref:AAA family ATPase n=1 Tax=Vibrio parahaemolyticus TaxID=670 RepID=UPI0038925A8F